MSPSAGKICSANQGMSALSTQIEKKELSVQWFWVTSGSVKSHLVCFMIFWETKPEKHLSVFQLMEVWQSKQLAQYSVKNSTKIRMYATSLNNNKKSKFSSQSYYDLFFSLHNMFSVTAISCCHRILNYPPPQGEENKTLTYTERQLSVPLCRASARKTVILLLLMKKSSEQGTPWRYEGTPSRRTTSFCNFKRKIFLMLFSKKIKKWGRKGAQESWLH